MPSFSSGTIIVFWIIAAITGGLFAILGNELGKNIIYFFSRRGRPPTQRPFHLWLLWIISFVCSLGFGALATYAPVTPLPPKIMTPASESGNLRAGQLQQAGAYVRILDFMPDPKATVLHPGDNVAVTVLFEYNLPGKAAQPAVQLKYLRSTDPMFSWNVVQQQVAQVGIHNLQLSGQFIVPELPALNGEPFQIAVEMVMLDEDLGRINSVAVEKITMTLEATE